MKRLFVLCVVLAVAFVVIGEARSQDKKKKDSKGDKPKYTIKQVMKQAMKGGLCQKVVGGKATDKEKSRLVDLFDALSQNKPPKGDADSWNEKTAALVEGAAAAKAGEGGEKLKKAANCKACHDAHKGR